MEEVKSVVTETVDDSNTTGHENDKIVLIDSEKPDTVGVGKEGGDTVTSEDKDDDTVAPEHKDDDTVEPDNENDDTVEPDVENRDTVKSDDENRHTVKSDHEDNDTVAVGHKSEEILAIVHEKKENVDHQSEPTLSIGQEADKILEVGGNNGHHIMTEEKVKTPDSPKLDQGCPSLPQPSTSTNVGHVISKSSQPNSSSESSPPSGINIVTNIVSAPGGSSERADSESTTYGLGENYRTKRLRIKGIPEESRNFDGFTQRQLFTLTILALSDFVAAILLTNQNPWFPIQASEHGISVGLTGIVFAAFELAVFIFFPLVQGKIHRCCVSPQTLFHLGIFTTSTCAILFAFLAYVKDWRLFYGLAIVLRFVEGIGQAALISTSFAIIALEFPTSISTAFVSLQTFFGLGLVVGPPLGGTLWDAYPSPERFLLLYGVLGAVSLVVAIAGLLFLPQSTGNHSNDLDRHEYTNGFRIVGLLKVNSVPLMGFVVFSTAVSIGFLYVTLSPLLFEFKLHPVLLGGIFLLNGGIGGLLVPVFSSLVGLTHRSKLLTILGAVFIFGGFLLVGPATFIPLQKSPELISIGLLLHGLGIASLSASTFRFILYQAVKCGYADNVKTYWLVSSLWTMLFCSGILVGTLSSGFLFDSYGFPNASWLILDLQILVVVLTLVSLLCAGVMKFQTSPKPSTYQALDTESEPLLGDRPTRRSKFGGFHGPSKSRHRNMSDPSSEPKLSPLKKYSGIEDTDDEHERNVTRP